MRKALDASTTIDTYYIWTEGASVGHVEDNPRGDFKYHVVALRDWVQGIDTAHLGADMIVLRMVLDGGMGRFGRRVGDKVLTFH